MRRRPVDVGDTQVRDGAQEDLEVNPSKNHRATLGRGKYRATQCGDKVVVFAEGDTPTPNYKVWLHYGPERIFPPILELWWLPPKGFQIQMLSPFRVHASFNANMKLETVQVRDAEGTHGIEVEQIGWAVGPATGSRRRRRRRTVLPADSCAYL